MDFSDLNIFKSSEEEIINNKRTNTIYVSDFKNSVGKYISIVFEENEDPYDIKLIVSPKIELRITYIFNNDSISGIKINKLKNGSIEEVLNLSNFGFKHILGLLKIFSEMDLKSIANKSIILNADSIENEVDLRQKLNTILADRKGLQILNEIANSKGLTVGDIENISQKKESLELFKKLLNYEEEFEKLRVQSNKV